MRATTTMCAVPAGRFLRGSLSWPDEQPVSEIDMDAFYIDKDPVTNHLFSEFVIAGGYRTATYWTPPGWDFIQANGVAAPNYWDDPTWAGDPEVPVTGVSWWEALAFARWAGKTLPTEAQWEYACRGRSGKTYPWGDETPDTTMANFAPGSEPLQRQPTRPDAYAVNVSEFGCRDLVGNFAEWCLDNYVIGYPAGVTVNPLIMTSELDGHAVRGGCGLHDKDHLRCTARDHYHPSLRDNLIGFRCVLPAKP